MRGKDPTAVNLTIQFDQDMWLEIEDFRTGFRPIPSQSEAVRRLAKRSLVAIKKERETAPA
jgi:hypothetical protein